MSTAPWYSRWTIGRAIVRGDRKPPPALPQHEEESIEDPVVSEEIAHCERNSAYTRPSKKEWVMLCFPGADKIYDLYQVGFAEPPTTNAAFFKEIRTVYEAKRTPMHSWWQLPWFRKVEVTEVHFIEFRSGCTIPTQEILPIARPGLPDNEEGWACTLITPTIPPTIAPVRPNTMAQRLHGLKVPREGDSMYHLVPRK